MRKVLSDPLKYFGKKNFPITVQEVVKVLKNKQLQDVNDISIDKECLLKFRCAWFYAMGIEDPEGRSDEKHRSDPLVADCEDDKEQEEDQEDDMEDVEIKDPDNQTPQEAVDKVVGKRRSTRKMQEGKLNYNPVVVLEILNF